MDALVYSSIKKTLIRRILDFVVYNKWVVRIWTVVNLPIFTSSMESMKHKHVLCEGATDPFSPF